ncbi:hypothetical protein DBR43_09540 [Pedobacter sp. KBW06]|uniref:type IV toxin-antitoxin system AbiEi family antitoxin domain-containing protein n=1 Tax=Pedobacter sp. KBW06 TaxID=2153359 RepID=UPI000F5B4ED0|nr:hypothetical protein [Pedobacter sp. KBW06]RQO75570.1 hypothetical protein DBR43_09540 [Pedobacter sp. KBW06]
MANKPRFLSVLPEIIKTLTKDGKKVYTKNYLDSIFEKYKDKWRLPLYMDLNKFLDQLAEQEFINEADFKFPGVASQRLFYLGDAFVYDIASSIFPKGYLSHYSAITIWGLSEQIPKKIYITVEQSSSPVKLNSGELLQKNIDAAFQKPQRQSETTVDFKDYQIVLLRGKYTNNLGQTILEESGEMSLKVTDLERTLIDIVVRPSYSGGISEVIKAFRVANQKHKVSINRISAYLNKMAFTYPYDQAIGFYLEAAGNYRKSQIDIFLNRPKEHDFYLAYEMKDIEYSEKWRIFYPAGLI